MVVLYHLKIDLLVENIAKGEIKEVIKNAILDGEIRNDYDEAYAMMERLAAERGFTKVENL